MGHQPCIGDLIFDWSTAMSRKLKANEKEAIELFQKAIDLGDGDTNCFVRAQYPSAQTIVRLT